MANKNLTDLTARTATADTDLIHVNSGGTDYKEQKIDFLEGALYHKFNTSSLLTSQIDALPLEKTFFGMINSYGHTSETGVPLNASFFVTVYNTDNNGYRYAEITSVGSGVVYTNTKNGTSWVGWTAVPTRAEITSLNSSLANSCKILYISGNAGAISSGAHGYVSLPYTVPSGYKTTGLFGLSIGHPGAAGNAGFQVSGSLGTDLTGEQTAYVSYIAPYGALSAANSDFAMYIHCVPTSWPL